MFWKKNCIICSDSFAAIKSLHQYEPEKNTICGIQENLQLAMEKEITVNFCGCQHTFGLQETKRQIRKQGIERKEKYLKKILREDYNFFLNAKDYYGQKNGPE